MKKSIATLAVLVLALSAGAAMAGTGKYPTEFKKFKSGETYAGVEGKIASPNRKCLKKRTINVYEKGQKGKVASGTTNKKGKFEIGISGEVVKGTKYYGKVTKKKIDGGEVCKGAKSKAVKQN